jgi:hypothetical protein
MNLQQSPTIDIEHPDVRTGSETLLHGRWLLIARMGWIVLMLLVLALSAIAIPRANALFQSVCQPGASCLNFQLTQADLRLLHQLGLSPGFLAAYQVVLDVGTLLVYSALAVLIFWRRSQDRMALFCAYSLVLTGGATYTGLLDVGLRSVAPVWFWLVGVLELLGQVSFAVFFLLFPSGRLVPRWTRWGVPFIVLNEVWYVFFVNEFVGQSSVLNPLLFAAQILGLVGLQIYRYRRVSTFRERQQTRWVVFGISVAIGGFVLLLIIGSLPVFVEKWHSQVIRALIEGPAADAFLLLTPISIAIAILRSNLYDIDTLINRTLVYGLLTGILGALYVGLIIGLESLAGAITGQASTNPFVLVISTLAIAALFQPLRRRVQNLIDRRFYRRKYDAARMLEAFSATLRSEADLNQLCEHLVAVVQETMQPTHVSLWLRPSEQQERAPRKKEE